MSKEKKSFFERLTGTVRLEETADMPKSAVILGGGRGKTKSIIPESDEMWPEMETDAKEAELTVDVFQTPDMIIVKAMTAGVQNEDLDISIARDSVTIRGHREEDKTARDEDYFVRELYWGSFSRTIALPEEVDVDEAEAVEKHGLIILKLPKLDKSRQTKLKVKTI